MPVDKEFSERNTRLVIELKQCITHINISNKSRKSTNKITTKHSTINQTKNKQNKHEHGSPL